MSEEPNTESAIRLRLSADFKGEIEKAAEAMHISVSALTRIALAEYLRERNAAVPKTEEAA
jgi:predicted transcriptional regulator